MKLLELSNAQNSDEQKDKMNKELLISINTASFTNQQKSLCEYFCYFKQLSLLIFC